MKYVQLGNSDLKVSPIALGCMGFGTGEGMFPWSVGYDQAKDVIAHAYDLGINFFDTANTYSNGVSEEILGRALKENKIDRSQVIIASKVYFNEGRLSSEAIHREIDGTLKRLGTDYLDLYIIHRFDYDTPIAETMTALDDLVKAGKVRAIGASAMYGYQFHNMQVYAKEHGLAMFQTMENHYNLLYREDERKLIPICKQYNVSLMPYSSLAGGHLAHLGWQNESKRSQTDRVLKGKYDRMEEFDYPIVKRVNEVAQAHNVAMSTVALAWQWAKGVTAPIMGTTKTKHLDSAVAAFDLKLSPDEVNYLDELYVPHPIIGALDQNPPQGTVLINVASGK